MLQHDAFFQKEKFNILKKALCSKKEMKTILQKSEKTLDLAKKERCNTK